MATAGASFGDDAHGDSASESWDVDVGDMLEDIEHCCNGAGGAFAAPSNVTFLAISRGACDVPTERDKGTQPVLLSRFGLMVIMAIHPPPSLFGILAALLVTTCSTLLTTMKNKTTEIIAAFVSTDI
jgi:hypothetical protein